MAGPPREKKVHGKGEPHSPAARRKPPAPTILALLLAVATELTMASSIDQVASILPAEIDGWKKIGPPLTFTKNNLYDYIDGGAELYISYNFQKLLAIRYEDGASDEIVIDVFDMGDSYDAFGVFSHGREVEDGLVGQGSEYNSGLLTFWKDRYYISIMAYPETERKKRIAVDLGRRLAGAIAGKGEIPPIVDLFPRPNFVPGSLRYFRHHVWLNSHFFVSNENILGIDRQTHSALAKYRQDEKTFFLLIVLYPDGGKVRQAEETFLKTYLPSAEEGMAEMSPGKWTGCLLEGNALSVVFQAPTRDLLRSYLRLAQTAIRSRAQGS